MAKFPTYEEMGKKVAEKALDEFLYNGKSIREWMQIISSEDAISRQAVLNVINSNCIYENEYNLTAKHIKDAVKQLPPVTQEPKIGHWIVYAELTGEWEGTKKYACDKCGEKVGVFKSNYCPNCGAKMVEPQESEDKNDT